MKILWVRILLAGIALELLYGLFLVFVLGDAEIAYTTLGIVSVALFMAAGGLWIGFNSTSNRVFHGGLVGVVAVLFYSILTAPAVISGELAVTGPFLLNHAAKILGAIGGGLLAQLLASQKKTPRKL